jgi:hypothetical protein
MFYIYAQYMLSNTLKIDMTRGNTSKLREILCRFIIVILVHFLVILFQLFFKASRQKAKNQQFIFSIRTGSAWLWLEIRMQAAVTV